MVFPDDTSCSCSCCCCCCCSCGIYYEELITYRAIDDLPPFTIHTPRCVRCGGLITSDQRERRAEHISRALEIFNEQF